MERCVGGRGKRRTDVSFSDARAARRSRPHLPSLPALSLSPSPHTCSAPLKHSPPACSAPQVTTSRKYEDRLETLANVRDAGISVCAGGIIGLGEGEGDRVGLIHQLATLPAHPESVPINRLVAVKGTPFQVGGRADQFKCKSPAHTCTYRYTHILTCT